MEDSSLLFEASAVRASVRSRAMGVPVEACVSDWSSCDSALLAALLVDADWDSDLRWACSSAMWPLWDGSAECSGFVGDVCLLTVLRRARRAAEVRCRSGAACDVVGVSSC